MCQVAELAKNPWRSLTKNPGSVPAMGRLTKHIKTLNDLFVHWLQDVDCTEQRPGEALPKLSER